MKKLLSICAACLLLPLFIGCSAPEQTGLVIGPPPPPSKDPGDDPADPGDDPEDPGTPAPDDPNRPGRMGKTPIVAVYFTEYTKESEFPSLEDVKCFTHMNVGHVRFVNKKTGDGGLEIEDPGPAYMRRLAAYKTSYPELKLLLFIGGWGKNADGFSMMARDPAKRKLFCDECVRLCNEFNFDGVDLDWEYPTVSADKGKNGYEGTGADPSDTENFTLLVKELRAALGKDKLISYAASSSGEYMNHKEVLQWVDYINVMTYSMGDPPYHNSPLYRSELTRKRSGEEVIENFHNNKGVPFDRMNYGIGFYGHGDDNVYPSSVQYYLAVEALQKGYYTKDGKQYDVTGKNIRCWDAVGKNCYLGDAAGKMYASYEDKESIGYRVEFLKSKGMLGAFGWEYREDAKDGTLRKELYRLMTGGAPDPVTPDPPAAGTDLGASGTANCYIVSAPGSYKFKAVKGNTTTSVGTVSSAEVLWESYATSETPAVGSVIASASYADGYIHFSTPATLKPGNAVIAAKNISGTILWSWHIWIPKTDVTSYGASLSQRKIMSRNLGALVDAGASSADPLSYGLFYQWGRKDPFPGSAKVAGTGTTVSASAMSVTASASAPTTFVAIDGDWNTDTGSEARDLWGDRSKKKTVNDPCPPGYMVPRRQDISPLFYAKLLDSFGQAPSFQYNSTGGYFTLGNPSQYFPLAGYISSSTLSGSASSQGSYARIWNSHSNSDDSIMYGYAQTVSSTSSSYSSTKKAYGASVRCVAETVNEKFVNKSGMPVQSSSHPRKEFGAEEVIQISGLCLSKDNDFLWGVSDKGHLYKFSNIDGDVSGITVTDQFTYDADMEGVTLDPATGNLYLAIEPKRVYRLSSPYTSKTTLWDVADAENMGNSGLEGIAWYKGDLYLGAQTEATLWRYNLSGTKLDRKKLSWYAPDIVEVGDLYYDSQTDQLWVSDSEAFKIFVFNGAVTELLAIYDISYIGNPETVCVDHQRKCVWLADDGSTSKIYKVPFTGL